MQNILLQKLKGDWSYIMPSIQSDVFASQINDTLIDTARYDELFHYTMPLV